MIIFMVVIISVDSNNETSNFPIPKNQSIIPKIERDISPKVEESIKNPSGVMEEEKNQTESTGLVEDSTTDTDKERNVTETVDKTTPEITSENSEEDRHLIHFQTIVKNLAEEDLRKAQSKCLTFAMNCLAKDCSAINEDEWSSKFWIKFFKELNDEIKRAFFIWNGNYLVTPSCKMELKEILDIFSPLQEKFSAALDKGRRLGLFPGDIREAFDTYKINMLELEKLCRIMEEIRDARYFWGDN
jgi:hypothetical protein